MIGVMQGVLDLAEDDVDSARVFQLDAGATAASDHRLVRDIGVGEAADTTETIVDDDAIGVDALLGPRGQFALAQAFDDTQPQLQRSAIETLGQHGHKGDVVGRAATRRLAVTLTTPIRVIDFDHAGQQAAGVALAHDLQEFVLDAPGGVTGDIKPALELQRGDGVFLLHQQVHGQEPGGQWQFAVSEHRASAQRRLMAAVLALQQPAGLQIAVALGLSARRANELLRPAPL